MAQLGIYSKNSLNALSDFLRDVQVIAQKAEQEEAKAKNGMRNVEGLSNLEQLSEAARNSMDALYKQLEEMEVCSDAVN